jgi:hypothetical protein
MMRETDTLSSLRSEKKLTGIEEKDIKIYR